MERFLKTKASDYRKKKKSNTDAVGTYKIQSVSLMFAFVCVSICPCIRGCQQMTYRVSVYHVGPTRGLRFNGKYLCSL